VTPFAVSLDARSFRAAVWAAGLAALMAGAFAWVVSAHPYEAPWAWVSFIGMCIVEDYLAGSEPDARWGQPAKLTLFAAIIVFRRHPEITMLVALVSAPLASLLKGQSWSTQVTATAQWMVAAVVGAATFRAVGFEDTTHFVAATAVLMLVYYATGPLLGAWVESRLSDVAFRDAFQEQRRFAISMQVAGILLAMAWRTAAFQPAALKVADGALVGVVGISAGFLLGGRPAWLFRGSTRVPQRGAIAGGVILVAGLLSPAPFSWLLPLGLGIAAAIWSIPRQAYPVLCCALGAVCNETVRAVNGGYMPVEGSALMSGLGAANTYVQAGPQTALAWLDDRFSLPPPFPGIASAGDILIALGMAWLVAAVIARHRRATATEPDVEELAMEAAA
jgi:hypothetical protein